MVKKKNCTVIIQARYASKRFEGKVLKKIKNLTILEIIINRLKKSKKIDKIVVACSTNSKDKQIINICNRNRISYFAGSENNVLERFFKTAKKYKIKHIVRITSDCPFIDPELVDKIVKVYEDNDYDYVSNVINPTYPDGLDTEIFSFDVLKDRYKKVRTSKEKEHVTYGILNSKQYKKNNIENKKDYSKLRLTLDTHEDFEIIKKVFKKFNYDFFINFKKIINLYEKNSKFFNNNSFYERNSGMNLSTGQKFWIRAQNIIPGGTMLFSKNPDLQLPTRWPAYFSKTKGCKVWDLDGNKFNDLFLMGIGTNSLGYSHPEIDKRVKKVVDTGNMSSLNSVDEILLAEKLIELNPWAGNVRFTRSGGEANAVAIRIARAYSGKDNIAICGYHGWHDWYLSANLKKKSNLNDHLIKDLNISGVPKKLVNTAYPFEYNNFEQLKKIVLKNKIGVIKMEVERDQKPKNGFLKKVRNLATKNKIVLIFDECTSGFRETYGGLHLKYKINPDICIFGKALGNGYGINAIVGKQEIMEALKSTFISSTFWTERIGSVAALQTLKEMKKINSWERITKIGIKIKKNWADIANLNSLKIDILGIDALPKFLFKSDNHLAYKTYLSQEMLKQNILASNVIYASIAHENKILEKYFDNLNKIFKKITQCEKGSENIFNLLETKVSLSGIRSKKLIK